MATINSKLMKETLDNAVTDLKDLMEQLGTLGGELNSLNSSKDWTGPVAVSWFADAYMGLANSYLRCARSAERMRVLAAYTYNCMQSDIDSLRKRKKTESKKYQNLNVRVGKVSALIRNFKDIRDDAKVAAERIYLNGRAY